MKQQKKPPNREEIEAVFTELFKDLPPIGPVGDSGWYQLGKGCYTGKAGWDKFQEFMKEEIKEKYGKE